MNTDFPHTIDEALLKDSATWQKSIDGRATARSGEQASPSATMRSSRTWALLAGVALVILVVGVTIAVRNLRPDVGANQPTAGPGGSAAPTPGTLDTKRPAIHDHLSVPVTPATRLTTDQLGGGISLAWHLTAVDNRAATVTIAYDASDRDCLKPRGIYVSETPTSVLIENVNYWARPKGSACSSKQTFGAARIQLTRPLGTRSLVHATLDRDFGDPDVFP